jgi:hypothetical protein
VSQRAGRTPLASLIAELKKAYRKAGLDCGKSLMRPAAKTALDRLAFELSLPLPAELLELYAVHGGQRYVCPGITGLFGEHRLHTPAQCISCHRLYTLDEARTESDPWSPRLIPFASWDANHLCIDATSGEVCEFTPNYGRVRSCHRPSIAAVLTEMLEAVRAGEEPLLREKRLPGV